MQMRRLLLGTLMFCSATFVWAQKVHVDWNRETDFSKYQTYAWLESKDPAQGSWNGRIIDDVDAKLSGAGWKKVALSAHPEVEVVYNAGVIERTTVEGYPYECGPGWWYGLSSKPKLHYIEQKATLVVDIVDPRAGM